jgi:hypothetical protein
MNRRIIYLFVGDILVISLVAITGFATHGTLGSAGVRLLATLIPYLVAWFVAATPIKALDPDATQGWGLWRPVWAVLLAAPFGAWLRGIWLQLPVQTTFVWVMLAFIALGIIIWRLFYNYVIFLRTGT